MTAVKLPVTIQQDGLTCDVPGCDSKVLVDEKHKNGWATLTALLGHGWASRDICPLCCERFFGKGS